MAGLAPRVPLSYSSSDGYTLIRTMEGAIKQNLKMLILTVPGERIMDPLYGVGMKKYLFRNFHENTYTDIDLKIREQVGRYMPYIKINRISFNEGGIDRNQLSVELKYTIPRIAVTDLLQFTI